MRLYYVCNMNSFTVLVIVASLFIGLSKGGLGGPVLVAMITPLLSLAMPASQAVGLVLPLLIFADIFAVYIYWKKWDVRQIKLLLPLGIVGTVLGGLALLALAEAGQDILLRRIIGGFTLVFVIYKLGSSRLTALAYQPQTWHGYVAGWIAGFGSALANMGAPPFTAYMLLQRVAPMPFIGTSTLFFAIVNTLKLPLTLASSKVLDLHLLASIAWTLPLIPFGIWIGKRFVRHINPVIFERLMLALLVLLGIFMLVYTPG